VISSADIQKRFESIATEQEDGYGVRACDRVGAHERHLYQYRDTLLGTLLLLCRGREVSDAQCRTTPSGTCISGYACVHGPGMSAWAVVRSNLYERGFRDPIAKQAAQQVLDYLELAGYEVRLVDHE